uniref:Uncharacterized protein n=1 Tax=Anguilla anguilla TaxID=7936 RepID=A0A0E9UZM2_ANGAN
MTRCFKKHILVTIATFLFRQFKKFICPQKPCFFLSTKKRGYLNFMSLELSAYNFLTSFLL